jgi:double zinc ribbon protein
MQAKKKLISRLAVGAGSVLVIAAIVGLVCLRIDWTERRRFEDSQERQKQQRIEKARAYLVELAGRINKLPVDPTLVSEIESHYFEEQASGPFYVWAMDVKGDFQFGVPQAAFNKVNAVYDSEVTPRLKEGVLLDRQTFLMSLVDDSDDINPELVEGKAQLAEGRVVELVERGRRFRYNRWEPERSFVLSTPLKRTDGGALGSLYLKRNPMRDSYYRRAEALEAVGSVSGVIVVASLVFLWVLLPTWVYVDARGRGVRRAPLFAFLTVISSLIGLVVYLMARPEDLKRLTCPGCAREVNGGAFCPHCGRDLSSAICSACRYPLKPDWAYCPACRNEVKPQPAGTPVPEAT